MNKSIIPIFSSHFSAGKSILTVEKAEEISEIKPVSVFSIAKQHKLEEVCLVENNFSGFINSYKAALDSDVYLRFAIKLAVCSNALDLSPESMKTESKVIIWMKNSKGYKDLIRIYSYAATKGFFHIPRIDWKTLQSMWTENLFMSIPSYASFLHRNMLERYECIPEFGKIKPNIMYSRMGLPFDYIIEDAHRVYAKNNHLELVECHPVRFYSEKYFQAYYTYGCIARKSSLSDPKADHFGSREFCWSSYLKK